MLHVFPLNDSRKHDTSFSGADCHCNPRIIVMQQGLERTLIVVHNPYDARDAHEQWQSFESAVQSWANHPTCP